MSCKALRIAAKLLLSLATPALADEPAAPRTPDPQPPNIVFILFDDMGYGEPSCYRENSAFKTPKLDQLAKEGMRFTDAHTAASVCTPTRYGLLTGRYPSRIGQYGVLTTYSPPIIPKTRLTVASLLKRNGYETACIGKWHLGMKWDGKPGTEKSIPVGSRLLTPPNAAGFDYFYGFTHARNIGTIIEQDRVVENVAEVDNQPRMIAKAVEWIGQRDAAKPFFLYFPMCPPHTPVVPAPEFAGKSGVKGAESQYADWVYQGDHMLGQLLDALERKGLADNSLVIVSADNGAADRSYPPLRGSKSSIHEGGHRVPFLARWPGKIQPGSVSDATICLNDLMATTAEILGAKLPDNAGEDSVSILPVLLGTAKNPVRESTVHQSSKRELAFRHENWKLIYFPDGKRELYDLKADVGETKDVSATNPEVVERLTSLMRTCIADGRTTPGTQQKNEATISLGAPPPNKKKARKGPKK